MDNQQQFGQNNNQYPQQPVPQPQPVYQQQVTPVYQSPVQVVNPVQTQYGYQQPQNNYPMMNSAKSFANKMSLILGASAALIVLFLIFIPKASGSLLLANMWMILLVVLSGGGLFYGVRTVKKTGDPGDVMNLVGIVVSVVMLLMSIFIGAYSVKAQLAIRSFKNSYNSSKYNTDY